MSGHLIQRQFSHARSVLVWKKVETEIASRAVFLVFVTFLLHIPSSGVLAEESAPRRADGPVSKADGGLPLVLLPLPPGAAGTVWFSSLQNK